MKKGKKDVIFPLIEKKGTSTIVQSTKSLKSFYCLDTIGGKKKGGLC